MNSQKKVLTNYLKGKKLKISLKKRKFLTLRDSLEKHEIEKNA